MNTHRSAYFVGLLWVTVPCAVIPVEASPPSSYYVTDLGSLGGAYTYGIGINASGQVSGYSYISGDPFAGGEFHAFLWTPTTSNGVSRRDAGPRNSWWLV